MNGLTTHDGRNTSARNVRHDRPVPADLSPEAGYLAFWISRQARLYGDLLRVVAHAPHGPGRSASQPGAARV
jgi:hypothetical protein